LKKENEKEIESGTDIECEGDSSSEGDSYSTSSECKFSNSSNSSYSAYSSYSSNEVLLPTVVFGPTCDGLDQLCSMETTKLPRCEVNEWLYWENMGAYTHTASFLFNGYTHIPSRYYCYLEDV